MPEQFREPGVSRNSEPDRVIAVQVTIDLGVWEKGPYWEEGAGRGMGISDAQAIDALLERIREVHTPLDMHGRRIRVQSVEFLE